MGFSLELFDFLSPEITFYYKGKVRHSSIYSGILTIVSAIITLVFTIIFSQDLKRKNPSAFYYNRYIDNLVQIPYNSSGLFHLLNLTGGNDFPYETNRLFSIIGIDNYMDYFDFFDIESFDHYIYEYCDQNDIKGIEEIVLGNVNDFNKLFCVKKFYNKTNQKVYDLNNKEYPFPQLIHGASHPEASIYGIVVEKCKNSSIINNNNCYSSEIIDQVMKSLIGYSIDFIDHNIIIDNYANPISNIYHSLKNLYSFGSGYTTNHLNFLPTMLTTNKGFFLDDIVIINSYKFSFNEKLTTLFEDEEIPNKGIYAAFYFWFQNQEDNFVRSYKKIQDILGSITGIARIIFLCAKVVNLLIHNYTYINDMNHDMKTHYKFVIDKPSSVPNSPLQRPIQLNSNTIIKNNEKNTNKNSNKSSNNITQTNNNTKLNSTDKSNIQINCEITSTDRINEHLRRVNQNQKFKVSFWKIFKIFVIQKNNSFIKKLVTLRKFVIGEEIMYKYYFIISSIKSPIFEHNNILKEFDLFKEDTIIFNPSINHEKEKKNKNS